VTIQYLRTAQWTMYRAYRQRLGRRVTAVTGSLRRWRMTRVDESAPICICHGASPLPRPSVRWSGFIVTLESGSSIVNYLFGRQATISSHYISLYGYPPPPNPPQSVPPFGPCLPRSVDSPINCLYATVWSNFDRKWHLLKGCVGDNHNLTTSPPMLQDGGWFSATSDGV